MSVENPKITDQNNKLSSEILANPYPMYRSLRERDPVHWDESLGGWMLLRYSDVESAVQDSRLSSDRTTAYLSRIPEALRDHFQPFVQARSNMMLFTDPPKHTRLRNLLSKAFTPRVVEDMRPEIQETTDRLIKDRVNQGSIDIIYDIAYPLPITIVGALIGIPPEDNRQLRKWSSDFNRAIGGVVRTDLVEQAQEGILEMSDYFKDSINKRISNPRLDLISYLVNTGQESDKLSQEELVATCLMLVFAGHETTTNLIGNGMHALLRNPDQLRMLKEDPSLIRSAVEELLRYDCPVQLTVREAKEDMEISDKSIKKGQRIILMWGSANRDPEYFSNPDELDVKRNTNKHFSFGRAIHYCLGAPLARAEAQIAINTLVQRFPGMEIDKQDLEWQENFSFHGLKALPVVF